MMSSPLLRVLLIEDDAVQSALIEEFLALARPSGVHVACVTHLAAGLESLQQNPYDVVVMDLSLPDSYGLDTLLEVRKRAPDVPAVVMTGLMDGQLEEDAAAAGAAAFLVKGQVRHDEVVQRILAVASAQGTEEGD